MGKYKYLLFDLDNTLLDFDASEKLSITAVIDKYNMPRSLASSFSQINDMLWKMLENGEITREELKVRRFELLLEQANRTDIDAKVISGEYFEMISNTSIPYAYSYEILKKCTDLGYKIVIVTNGSAYPQRKRICSCNISCFFSKIFISEEIGLSKPNKTFYDYVLKEIRAEASQCLIIGDSLSSDILGGINSRIDTCWYNPKGLKNAKNMIPTYTVNDLNQIFSILGE